MTTSPAQPPTLISDTTIVESSTALRRTAKIKTHLVPLTSHFATDRRTALA